MVGSYISDDYYFFFDETSLYWLERGHTRTGDFVCKNNKPGPQILRMALYVNVDHGSKKEPSNSSVNIDFESKICRLNIAIGDFNEWFVNPDQHVKLHGPNWRFASCNVYIKTESSVDSEVFKNNILGFLNQAPKRKHPINHKLIAKLKK